MEVVITLVVLAAAVGGFYMWRKNKSSTGSSTHAGTGGPGGGTGSNQNVH